MDEKEESYSFSPSAASSRRLSVLQGHLKSSYPGATGVCASPCGGGSKVTVQSSAPMSSRVDEVQKAFPRQRYGSRCVLFLQQRACQFISVAGVGRVSKIIYVKPHSQLQAG